MGFLPKTFLEGVNNELAKYDAVENVLDGGWAGFVHEIDWGG